MIRSVDANFGRLRAVLLLSDGDWNQGSSPVAAATRLRTWRIRLADRDAAAAAAPVAEALGLDPAAIPVDRRDLLVSIDSDASAASALAALVAAGLPVAEFAAATGLLEHTFLDLEGGRP